MSENLAKTGPQVAVVGVGHGGAATVARLVSEWPDSPRAIVIGVDRESLNRSLVPAGDRVLIGEAKTRGMSTGGNVDLGREAAEADRDLLQGVFTGVNMAFLVGGLGGGLATGAMPVLARMARAFGVMTVCVVTLPFDFEGENRRARAEEGLAELQAAADVVIAIPNQKLFHMLGPDLRVAEAFIRADAVLSRALYSVWRMISRPGLISLDYADLSALLAGSGGLGAFGYGDGTGPDKANEAARSLMANPLLDNGRLLHEAESVLVNIAGGPDLTLMEIESIMRPIRETVRKDAHLAMGTVVDELWRGRVTVTVLAAETWRKDASGQMQLPLDSHRGETGEETTPEMDLGAARKRRPARESQGQGALSLDGIRGGRGRFKDVEPTIVEGENADIPTFIRRGIPI
jgi:cell division protein FtsZ